MENSILIVDDESHIRILLQETLEELEDEGISLRLADNGRQALELIRAHSPRLVLLDVMMPEINGYDVCAAVRADLSLAGIHIILLTAKGQESDRQRGLDVGADEYVTKPFDPDTLLARARDILNM